ncbi:MAG TPA: bifunctional DNA-binding transcriptional regulator/O6-methylguanine-DNA methyltransferase Ada [Terriglobales bacterium]|nr:bifunctional DNA-binding transcriptional regulator/O6-methylguanine-DNA methyltransferase Ada [Terriglobales bacterium]
MAAQSTQSETQPGSSLPATSSPEWRAVVERDSRFDGIVYYAVLSTGIYCKPSCASRKPRPERVQLFFDRSEAESAGFRPCRRCRPENVASSNSQLEAVRRVCRYIDSNLEASLTLRELGSVVGLDPLHLQKVFKRTTGVTPRQYIEARRLAAFKVELRVNRRDVTDATYEVGYGSSSRIYERSSEQIGMTPGAYRKGAPGIRIRYATADCSLGRILLAASDRGVCSIKVGQSDSLLIAELFKEFPKALVEGDQETLGAWVSQVVSQVEGGDVPSNLPLDIQATAFQRRVFEALRRIPRGETRSYSQLATEIGAPTSCRAVAQACAHNPVAIVIPCHRVVQANGELGGYRWGKDRKKRLLETEAQPR